MNVTGLVVYQTATEPDRYTVYRSPPQTEETNRLGKIREWASGEIDLREDTGAIHTGFELVSQKGEEDHFVREVLREPLVTENPIEVSCSLEDALCLVDPLVKTVVYVVRHGELRVVVPLHNETNTLSRLTGAVELDFYPNSGPNSKLAFESWKNEQANVEHVILDEAECLPKHVESEVRRNLSDINRVIERITSFKDVQSVVPTGVVETDSSLIEVTVTGPVTEVDRELVYVEVPLCQRDSETANRIHETLQMPERIRLSSGDSETELKSAVKEMGFGTVVDSGFTDTL